MQATDLFACRCTEYKVVVDRVGLDSIHKIQDGQTCGNARVLETGNAGGLTSTTQLREGGREGGIIDRDRSMIR